MTVKLGENETALLRTLLSEYEALLDDSSDEEDPVIARLYPPASNDDDVVRISYDELTRGSLESHKRGLLKTAQATIGDDPTWNGILTEEQGEAWLALLTDLRLAIGARLNVDEETMSMPIDPQDPKHYPLAVLHYLGSLQESLVEAS